VSELRAGRLDFDSHQGDTLFLLATASRPALEPTQSRSVYYLVFFICLYLSLLVNLPYEPLLAQEAPQNYDVFHYIIRKEMHNGWCSTIFQFYLLYRQLSGVA
jgi:hypothetical protein